MPRLKLIMNPQADHGNAKQMVTWLKEQVEKQAIVAAQNGRAYELSWEMTEHPRHAIDLAQEAADEKYDVVVAIGGDGTVHEAVNGLMQVEARQRPRLGIVPIGSGNDFAHNLGLPYEPMDAIGALFSDQTRLVDAGSIVDGTGRHEYWNNTVGIGFSGAVNIAARSKKRWRGFLLYFVSVLETILFKPPALYVQIEIDEEPPFERWISMMSLCNGPREGGGFPVAPAAVMDDGLISTMTMRRMNRLEMLYFLPIVMNAKHPRYTNSFTAGTARRVRIEADRTMAIHIDGETFGPWEADIRQVEISIIPAALQVLCGE